VRQNQQLIVIALAIGMFAAAAVTGFGGWPTLIAVGLIAIAIVDGACRALDRTSVERSRGNFAMIAEPTVEVLRPAMHSDQVA
jgi:hypothetical protein